MTIWETLTSWLPSSQNEEKQARRLLENHVRELESDLNSVLESLSYNDRFPQPWERYFDGYRIGGPPSGYPRDRSWGRNLPILNDENDLRAIRSFSRLLCESNLICLGFRDHITNFVVGTGYTWDVVLRGQKAGPVSAGLGKDEDGDGQPDADPDVLACQQVLDEFRRLNGWGQSGDTIVTPDDGTDRTPKTNRERETYERAMEDGESFLRLFRGGADTNGVPRCRFIEPECVKTPPEQNLQSPWGWGIKTDPDDNETREAYYIVSPEGDGTHGQEVSATRVMHYKVNTKSSQKRGVPDFFPLQDEASGVRQLIRNMTEVSAILAAIAYIREHAPTTTGDQVNRMIDRSQTGTNPNQIPVGATYAPGPDRTRSLSLHEAGTIIDVSNQLRYTPGPINSGVPGFVQAAQATLRMCGLRWGCPEYFSGDASNANFASTLVSGGPFERSAASRQQSYSMFQGHLAVRVLWLAVEAGRLRREQVQRVAIVVTTPPVVISNKNEDTNRRRTLFDAKVLSPQTWAKEEGYDPAVESANWQAWNEQFPDESQAGLGLGGDGNDNPLAGFGLGESRRYVEWVTEETYALLSEAGRAGLVKKRVPLKKGGFTTKWVRPVSKAMTKSQKKDVAQGRLKAVMQNPEAFKASDLGTITKSLKEMTKPEVQALAKQLRAKVSGTKDEVITRVRDRIREAIKTGPAPLPETHPIELAKMPEPNPKAPKFVQDAMKNPEVQDAYYRMAEVLKQGHDKREEYLSLQNQHRKISDFFDNNPTLSPDVVRKMTARQLDLQKQMEATQSAIDGVAVKARLALANSIGAKGTTFQADVAVKAPQDNVFLKHAHPDPANVKFTEKGAQALKETNDWLSSVVGGLGNRTISVLPLTDQGRAHAYAHSGRQWVIAATTEFFEGGKQNVYVHEVAHHLETVGEVDLHTTDFRRYRLGSERLQKLSSIGMMGAEDHEYGAKDNFDQTFGRIRGYYAGYEPSLHQSGRQTTEILSMGLEQLYKDPAHLAHKDPEYFAFLVGVLKSFK